MKKKIIFTVGVVIILVLIGIIFYWRSAVRWFYKPTLTTPVSENKITNPTLPQLTKSVDFSKINPEFLFSAKIPKEFEAEYVDSLKAINVYNPILPGNSNIDKSQIYITFFQASKFLTLSTVVITRQDKLTINGHQAIFYEITKRKEFPDFFGQPSWRNSTHQALDVRLSQNNPTHFYSLAYNPSLLKNTIDDIVASLVFYPPNRD